MNKLIIITITILILSATSLIFPLTIMAQNKARDTITVVKLDGEDKEYEQFMSILKQRVRKIFEAYDQKDEFKYLVDLNIKKAGLPNSFKKAWEDSDAILILNSALRRDGKDIYVASDVYLFEIKGSLKDNSIGLEQMVSTDKFRVTRDTYSMIMYYALAMDAKRMNRPPNVIAEYLSRAEEISKDIKIKDKNSDVAQLVAAIKNESQSCKNKGKTK
jgi:hypothetical protein